MAKTKAKNKLKVYSVGEYPRIDFIKEYLTNNEYKYFKKNGRFSGGYPRRRIGEILDSLYVWEYNPENKSYIIHSVLEQTDDGDTKTIVKASYGDIDERCGELIAPLLLADILKDGEKYGRGLFDNSLSDVIGFQNRNYSLYEINKRFMDNFYNISKSARQSYNKYLLQRRKMMLEYAFKSMGELKMFKYERCWVAQKHKAKLLVKGGKYVVEETKELPQKANPYQVTNYKKVYNKLRKEYGIKKTESPYSSKYSRRFSNDLKDELFNLGICAFYKGVALENIDENKIKEYLKEIDFDYESADFIKKYKKGAYEEIRELLVDGYGRKKNVADIEVSNFHLYTETVIGEPFVPIERELEMNGIDPDTVIKYNTKTNNVEIGKANIVRKE